MMKYLLLSCLLFVTPVSAQTLKNVQLEDGTGTIGLAPGWKQVSAYRGAVDCTGPNGAQVRLGLPLAISVPIDPVTGLVPIAAGTMPTAQTGDVTTALQQALQKTFKARVTRMSRRAAGSAIPGVPAYYIYCDYQLDGKSYTLMGYFTALTYGETSPAWSLYSSGVIAPTPVFQKMLPTMLKMWASWKPNGQAPAKGSASALTDAIIKDRQASADRIHKYFREHLLGDPK